jgi:hypothetical protein
MYTYRELIRKYSADIAGGACDRDLTPQQRRLAQVLLNLASNTGFAGVVYPPTDGTRDDVAQYLGRIVWDARPLVDACSPAAGDSFSVALARALEILHNI